LKNALKSLNTLKIQRIQRPISIIMIKPVSKKRSFEFEFSEVEDSLLKLRKPTKKGLNPQKGVFSAGLDSPKNAIQMVDIQKTIQEALNPLIVEV
jgi:hypothetical protein